MKQTRKGRSLQPLDLNLSNSSVYIPHAPVPPKRGYSPDLESSSRRLEQLEIENKQLKRLLEEAELSIAGYKSVSIQTEVLVSECTHPEEHSLDLLLEQNESLKGENFNLRIALAESNNQQNKLKGEYEIRLQKLEEKLSKKAQLRRPLQKITQLNLTTLITSDLKEFQSFLCHSFTLLQKFIAQIPANSGRKYSTDCGSDPIDFVTPNCQNIERKPPTPLISSSTNTDPLAQMFSSSSQTGEWDPPGGENSYQMNQLTAVAKATEHIATKFGSEINAIKHLSHCKDLVRVASLRELGLEKDRLLNDLRYAREVQGVLWFSLETCEKMLKEINPQIVVKLQESRQKRMLILERDASEKRRDIEQRSLETCTVSANHLETFQLKAEMRCKAAATEVQNSLVDLQKLLRVITLS